MVQSDVCAARWDKWVAVRQRGRGRFILRYGVLGWGVPTAFLWSAVMPLLGGHGTLLSWLPIALVTFPLGGIVFGAVMWSLAESRYRKWLAGRPAPEAGT